MNVLFVGTGSIARDHALALAALQATPAWPDLRLHAVVGRLPGPTAAFARDHGFDHATTDLDAALADPAIDAVLVCSPTDLHADQTERALRAGKHVLCEIPLATSLAATDRLIALADANNLRLGVCHTQRFFPALLEARRRVAVGELHPRALVARYGFLRRDTVNWRGHRRTWTDNLLWHHGAHAVDAALWLLGATDVEVAAQVALPAAPLDIPMDISLALRTPAERIATVALSYNTHLPVHDYLLIGDETTLLFADNALRSPTATLVPAHPDIETDPLAAPLAHQDADFLAALRDGRPPAIPAHAIRPTMAALQHAQETLDARLHDPGPAPPSLPST